MKIIVRLVLVSMLMLMAVSAYSSECVHMWKCEMEDDATEEQLVKFAHEWLNLAKKVKGGKNFKAYVYFPIAVNATGEMDFMFIVVAPSFEEWGIFWDNYQDSDAAQAEAKNMEWTICPDSVIWESVEIK